MGREGNKASCVSFNEEPLRVSCWKQHVTLTLKAWFLHMSSEHTELSVTCPVLLRQEWRWLVQIVEIEGVRSGSEHGECLVKVG